jgi:molybdenum cofactor synthesis domain-containing protein
MPTAGRHVRKAGFDFAVGDTVLNAGTQLTPGAIALAIAAGHVQVPVIAPPRVAVLDSGDELVPLGAEAREDQIPASNGVMIASMLQPLVGASTALGPVADDPAALAQALSKAEGHDILITSGGASVGDHDLIQQALKDWGADLAFWKVAIKPGKPLMVATRGNTIVLGLPGNPVSSFVTAFLFALPLVRAPAAVPALPPASVARSCLVGLPVAGFAAALLDQANLADHHALVDRLGHVIDGQQRSGDGHHRFHLHSGLARQRSGGGGADAVIFESEVDIHRVDCERMAQRDQFPGALCRHDPGYPRRAEHIALGRVA